MGSQESDTTEQLNWSDIQLLCNYYVWAGSESITFLPLPLHFMFLMSYFATFSFVHPLTIVDIEDFTTFVF